MSFIMAMGAEHTNTKRLHSIILCMERTNYFYPAFEPSTGKLKEKYNIPLERRLDRFDYVGEVKYDGFSYICSDCNMYSRRLSTAKGNEGMPVCKTSHVPHIIKEFERLREIGLDLDVQGELCYPNGTSDDVTRIMGCDADEAVKRQWNGEFLNYVLIDIRRLNNHVLINEPYYIRRAILEYIFVTHFRSQYISISEIVARPVEAFKSIVSDGGEGLVIKNTKALYVPGKKPADTWIKCKKKVTFDGIIVGYGDGTGKNQSLFGSIEFGMYVGNELKSMGSVSSGLDDATRKMIAADPDSFIGQVIEMSAMQESKTSFRNPVFIKLRPDKNAHECTLESVQPILDILECGR